MKRWVSAFRAMGLTGIWMLVLQNVSAQNDALKLMTFNVKGDDASAGAQFNASQSWVYLGGLQAGRKERAFHVIRDFSPDILAVQELKNNQLADIVSEFPEYFYFGQGRDGGNAGDRNGFFYRASRFSLSDTGSFWLSETPGVPGTTFQGNGGDTGNPRMAVWAHVHDAQTNVQFFILCTHWSLDDQARLESATLIRDTIEDIRNGLPVLLLGDLNEVEASPPFDRLSGLQNFLDVQLTDAYREVNAASVFERSYHNWGQYGTMGERVDHILHSFDEFETDSAWIDRWVDPANGYFPSDHYPIKSILRYAPWLLSRDSGKKASFSLYPNPAHSSLRSNLPSGTHYKITDVFGRIFQEGFLQEGQEMDIRHLSPGLFYFVADGFAGQAFIRH